MSDTNLAQIINKHTGITTKYDTGAYEEIASACKEYAEAYKDACVNETRQALHDLVRDLEMRSAWKEGDDQGVVDCGNGVYMKAKQALGEL